MMMLMEETKMIFYMFFIFLKLHLITNYFTAVFGYLQNNYTPNLNFAA